MKTLASIISYFFHPVFMPTIGMYIFLKYGVYISFTNTYIGFVSIVLFVFTCLLPLFTIMTLKMLNSEHKLDIQPLCLHEMKKIDGRGECGRMANSKQLTTHGDWQFA